MSKLPVSNVLIALALAAAVAAPLTVAPGRAAADTFAKTKYPIVLAHGLSGFRQLFGVVDYFYEIPSDLSSSGAQVFVTEVSAFASSEARGEQLLAQIENIVATTGAHKVNLIGHSQGGLDARYVMAVRPDLIASLTTVATPHLGADLADFLVDNLAPGGFDETVLAAFADSLGDIIELFSGQSDPQDALGALQTLSSAGSAAFNAKYPAGLAATRCGATPATANGIPLYSWEGSQPLTNGFDVSDPLLGLTSLVYSEDNDGLVGRCSGHFGKVLRDDYSMNHLDEVNQLFGLVDVFETSPTSVFRSHANRLKNAGL
jgi:triacylglycerol lipase